MVGRIQLVLAVFVSFIASPIATALTFRATVVKVVDGDTIQVRDETGRRFKIRLIGVDAPEKLQAFGERSRESLVHLLRVGSVFVDVQSSDRYRRLLAKVTCGGRDVGLEQLDAGYAWFYPWADSISETDRLLYMRDERSARAAHLGLWHDVNPIPPWQFRRQVSNVPPPTGQPVLSDGANVIIANRHSKVYHLPRCPSYNSVASQNRVFFSSVAEAEKAGYHRAGNCP